MIAFVLMILAWLFMFDSPKDIQGPPHQVRPLSHECNQYPELHYTEVDLQACKNHIDNPKYKRGEVLKITDNKYSKNCEFQVGRAMWGPIKNQKLYIGDVFCLDINNKYIKYDNDVFLKESILRK